MMTIFDFEKPINELESAIAELRQIAAEKGLDRSREIAELEAQRERLLKQIFAHLRPWDKVLLARHPKRPYALDYIRLMCESFLELHGDRLGFDDPAIVAGLAKMGGHNFVIVGQQKGRDLKERQKRNFGMAKPEGYRKAMRMFRLAEKFRLPVLTLVDTPAADPGVESEARGISESIAQSMLTLFELTVPTIAVILGEGGSGGAIALAATNRVLMLEHAIYSVIPPEGCAAILYRDPNKAPQAADALKLTAESALALGLIDLVIPEPLGAAHRDPQTTALSVRSAVLQQLEELRALSPEALLTASARWACSKWANRLREPTKQRCQRQHEARQQRLAQRLAFAERLDGCASTEDLHRARWGSPRPRVLEESRCSVGRDHLDDEVGRELGESARAWVGNAFLANERYIGSAYRLAVGVANHKPRLDNHLAQILAYLLLIQRQLGRHPLRDASVFESCGHRFYHLTANEFARLAVRAEPPELIGGDAHLCRRERRHHLTAEIIPDTVH
jgi:acetyl-CoA carboxylase carboxyl transferase subunit alpha